MNCTDAENLIYNRFDLIYGGADEIEIGGCKFQVVVHQQAILIKSGGNFSHRKYLMKRSEASWTGIGEALYIQITK